MAKAAASLLPGLLPTPPTRPCLIILPASFVSKPKTKPGRADSVERWDAQKKDKKPKSPASSCSSSSSSPGYASSNGERWDVNKKISGSSRTSSLSSSSSSRRSSTSPGTASSCGRWDSNKPLTASRTSSAARWDTHKKPRPEQGVAESWTGNKEDNTTAMVLKPTAPRIGPMFSGPSFVASPDPSMLPMPEFFRSRNTVVLPVQAF
ncbi:hypothetical protein D1007_23826 [Hordeum vulgare]|uniref:Uncharacterized protein n=1 Tax=Hordeum vulgare subsp. vulgare TaxID=112509 RepID=A0A8I6XN96_HORVV|nr:hypothetical protein D1007_23826 [Hordeum vulgare]